MTEDCGDHDWRRSLAGPRHEWCSRCRQRRVLVKGEWLPAPMSAPKSGQGGVRVGEQWQPVDGHPHYEVSDQGRVRSLDRKIRSRGGFRLKRGCLLKPGRTKSGHLTVAIGRGNSMFVHRLVLFAFRGPPPEGHESLHGDGDPSNNNLWNLRWGTRSENLIDRYEHERSHA